MPVVPPLPPLPIDPYLGAVTAAAQAGRPLVIVAEPGAGKTTRVPRALLEAGWGARGQIVVLEPRRLAARLASRRVAEELGEEPGGRVGYRVRFEDRTGPDTRVVFVTEGVLVRQFAARPDLRGVAVVILDEFHERSLDADLALALCQRARRQDRPDLRVVVMSATLDAEPVAGFLGGDVLRVPGRTHPVSVEYLARPDRRRLEDAVASGVHAALAADEADRGRDVLVFLPGAAEIRRCRETLAPLQDDGVLLAPLHGDLPPDEQDRAVRPGPARKVILATNVAETSITIEGVGSVVDSGLHRLAGHSPWSGLPTLVTAPISRASAAQRAGRAGRSRPGRCLRLYTREDHDLRPAFDAPEIRRADLAGLYLVAHAAGIVNADWFEPPPPAPWQAAGDLLRRLGALDDGGKATPLGRELLRFPLHPRAARLLLAAAEWGAAARGALVAALLSERNVRRGARFFDQGDVRRAAHASGTSDLLELAEAIEAGDTDLDAGAVRSVLRARDQLLRLAPGRATAAHDDDGPLLQATLLAFPDRVARRRMRGAREVVFAGGGAGVLAEECVVHDAELMVVAEAQEQRGRVIVRAASAIEPAWLLDHCPGRVRDETRALFDPAAERVEVVARLLYDGLVLEESRRTDVTSEEVARALFDAASGAGPAAFCDVDDLERWRGRLARARLIEPEAGWPAWDDADVLAALRVLCTGRRSFRELREADLVASLRAALGGRERRLDEIAPVSLRLPGGRTVAVHYEPGKPPWVESFLQDFFGMREAPRIGGEPLVLHLLAPSRRPVQVTSDLAGFWARTYPQLRTQLMRRYPKHSWPEDPLKV